MENTQEVQLSPLQQGVKLIGIGKHGSKKIPKNLTLEITDLALENLTSQLIDLQGRSIENKNIANTNETIKMENLPSATYFLKITNNNKEVKTFKIIKN